MAQTGPLGVALKSRGGANAATWFPEVVKGLGELTSLECVFDGEVCVLDRWGRSDFNRLHERAVARRWKSGLAAVVYCVFDMPVHAGHDICEQPLSQRQALLESVFKQGAPSLLRVSGCRGEGIWLFEQARHLQLEGIVAKRLDSAYLPGQRTSAWLKVKRKGAIPAQRFGRPPMMDPLEG